MERSDEGTNPMLRNFCCPTDGVKDDSMVGCLPVVNNMVFDGMRYDAAGTLGGGMTTSKCLQTISIERNTIHSHL